MTKEKELEENAEIMKGVTEFVIRITNDFGAPTFNTGLAISIDRESTESKNSVVDTYLVVNTENYASLFTTEDIVAIREGILTNDSEKIHNVSPYIRCVKIPKCLESISWTNSPNAGRLFGTILHSSYSALQHTNVGKCHYEYFASRFHVYFTNVIPGLNTGTRISLIKCLYTDHRCNCTKFSLVGFHSKFKKIIVRAEGSSDDLCVDGSQFAILNDITLEDRITMKSVDMLVRTANYSDAINSRLINAEVKLINVEREIADKDNTIKEMSARIDELTVPKKEKTVKRRPNKKKNK